jgi:AcrR family transcriptional regulator
MAPVFRPHLLTDEPVINSMPRHALRPARAPRAAARAPRWRRRPDERPAQILDAALIEFGERGLGRTRLDDIARRAGVAKGTIYLYFPTKDALFRAMVRHCTGRNITAFEQRHAASEAPAADQLHDYVSTAWSHLRAPLFPILYRLTIGELHKFPDLMRFYIQETAVRALKVCTAIIRRGVENGEFRRVDPAATARMVHGVIIKHAVWCAHRGQVPFVADTTDPQILREMLDFFDLALLPHPPAPKRRARPRRRTTA